VTESTEKKERHSQLWLEKEGDLRMSDAGERLSDDLDLR